MERSKRQELTRGAGWLGVMVGVFVLAGASPAKAGDEFEDGFKTALGAIAAHEVVGGGKVLLRQLLLGPGGYGHAGPYRHRGYRQHGYVHHPPYQPVNIHKVRKEYHYYGGGPPARTSYERYERYEGYDDGYRRHRHPRRDRYHRERYRDRYYDDCDD